MHHAFDATRSRVRWQPHERPHLRALCCVLVCRFSDAKSPT
jgi:hypothetical protein